MSEANKENNNKVELIPFLEANENTLVKFDEFKAKQEQLVNDNPFMEITDNKTYKEAKSRCANLRSGRTEIEGGDKKLGSFFSNFRKGLIKKNKELVEISKPAEDKQKAEITRWEEIKLQEKKAKEKAEEQRVENIKNKIEELKQQAAKIIEGCTYENMEQSNKELKSIFTDSEFDFEELEVLLDAEEEAAELSFETKCHQLAKEEADRKERIIEAQKNKVNEVKLHVIEKIDEATADTLELASSVKNYFDSLQFDFGDFTKEVAGLKVTYIEKAETRLNELKKQAEMQLKIEQAEAKEKESESITRFKDECFADINTISISSNYPVQSRKLKDKINSFAIEGVDQENIGLLEDIKKSMKFELAGRLDDIAQELQNQKEENEKKQQERIERLKNDKLYLNDFILTVVNKYNTLQDNLPNDMQPETKEFIENLEAHFQSFIGDIKEAIKKY